MLQVDEAFLEEVTTLYLRSSRVLDDVRLRAWEELGLSFPQLRILFNVRNQPGIGLRDLAERFGISRSAVSQQVDKLVVRGMLERSDNPDDRRHLYLKLTEDGEQATGELSRTIRERVHVLLNRLSDPELQDLHRLLTKLEPGS